MKKKEKKRQDLENKIKEMPDSQKDDFFSENIKDLEAKIELLRNEVNKQNLKELRAELLILYVARKKNLENKKNNWKYNQNL